VFAQFLGWRATRATRPEVLPEVARLLDYVATRLFMPASILIFIAGLVMTANAWSFGQTWIAISMGLWVLSVVLGMVYVSPRLKRIASFFETEGPMSTDGRALLDRVFLASRLELISFFVIVALMVFKPTTGAG
jgi:uncharacterized membrane protein